MSKLSSDPLLKQAMFEVYGGACGYTREPLNEDDFVLDHVVPEHVGRSEARRESVLPRYGLSPDFVIDHVRNLVPTTHTLNLAKLGKTDRKHGVRRRDPRLKRHTWTPSWETDAESMIRLGLDQADRHYDRVIARWQELKREHGAIAAYETLPFTARHRRRLADEASGIRGFGPRRTTLSLGRYTSVEPWVRLDVELPRWPDWGGSALLTLTGATIGEGLIFLDHRAVVRYILRGAGIAAADRAFTPYSNMGLAPGGKAAAPPETNGYWVHFGNVSLVITSEELGQLCANADNAAPVYVKAMRSLEQDRFRSDGFSPGRKGYRLARMCAAVWREIQAFARDQDPAAAGLTAPGGVFETPAAGIDIHEPDQYGLVQRARFRAELDDELADAVDVDPSEASVWVCWLPGERRSWAGEPFSDGRVWDAPRSQEFLGRLIEAARRPGPVSREREGGRSGGLAGRVWGRLGGQGRTAPPREPESIPVGFAGVEMAARNTVVSTLPDPAACTDQQGVSRFLGAVESGYTPAIAPTSVPAHPFTHLCDFGMWWIANADIPEPALNSARHALADRLSGSTGLTDALAARSRAWGAHGATATTRAVQNAVHAVRTLLAEGRPRVREHALLLAARKYLAPVHDALLERAWVSRLGAVDWDAWRD